MRLKAILGGFKPCVKFDILKVADRQVLAVWGIYHFPTAVGNARLRVSLRETKNRPLKKDKNKPQKLGRFEIFFRGLVTTFWHSRSHKIEFAVLGLLA